LNFLQLASRWLIVWLLLAVSGYAVCGLLGYLSPTGFPEPLEDTQSREALSLAFPGQRWRSAEGATHHGWLFRRSRISGISEDGKPHSEQVLKVGWPFTMARGFVWEQDEQLRGSGALTLERLPDGAYRFWPLQPVWPGLLIDSGLILLSLLVLGRVYKRINTRI